MIDVRSVFDQRAKNNTKHLTFEKLLLYPYFKKIAKMIAKDLSKEQALDAGPKTIQQTHFTGNLERARNTKFFIIE